MNVTALMNLLLSGKWLAAVGVATALAVWLLRSGWITKKIPWLSTKIGGYVLSYTIAFGTYFGTALASGTPIDLNLLMTALTTVLASSGVIYQWRDLVSAAKAIPPAVPPAVPPAAAKVGAVVLLLLMTGSAIALSSCGGATPTGGTILTSIVDCVEQGGDPLSQIEALAAKMNEIAKGSDANKWTEIELLAVDQGLTIGGCAFAEVFDSWIGASATTLVASSVSAVDPSGAKAAFESYRTNYAGGATFRTKSGDVSRRSLPRHDAELKSAFRHVTEKSASTNAS